MIVKESRKHAARRAYQHGQFYNTNPAGELAEDRLTGTTGNAPAFSYVLRALYNSRAWALPNAAATLLPPLGFPVRPLSPRFWPVAAARTFRDATNVVLHTHTRDRVCVCWCSYATHERPRIPTLYISCVNYSVRGSSVYRTIAFHALHHVPRISRIIQYLFWIYIKAREIWFKIYIQLYVYR